VLAMHGEPCLARRRQDPLVRLSFDDRRLWRPRRRLGRGARWTCSPRAARPAAGVAAEVGWSRLLYAEACRCTILPSCGIYGPGRSASTACAPVRPSA
jgi:hypothetical protein